jgi:aminoglycoside phosphotransferase (APT) family kinase protein
VYRQAGGILGGLQRPGDVSADYFGEIVGATRERMEHAAGLVPEHELAALRRRVDAFRPFPVRLHFTHGDYQPRNWLYHHGKVSVIDFGRATQRSWVSDLVRLRNQQFHGRPDRERAFMDGMGRGFTEADAVILELETLHESIGTVVWAHSIADPVFEAHGRTMIRRMLGEERTT